MGEASALSPSRKRPADAEPQANSPACRRVRAVLSSVRREGALHQRVQVPPEELSMRLGSCRARSRFPKRPWFRSPETKASERGLSKHAGRNTSEAGAGPERTDVDADPSEVWGRPLRWTRAIDRRMSSGLPGQWAQHACKARCATRETRPSGIATRTRHRGGSTGSRRGSWYR